MVAYEDRRKRITDGQGGVGDSEVSGRGFVRLGLFRLGFSGLGNSR
jgi:hypothetical protein